MGKIGGGQGVGRHKPHLKDIIYWRLMSMAYYSVCPVCGAHNDPGERCDCRRGMETQAGTAAEVYRAVRADHKTGSVERDADDGQETLFAG